MTYQIQLRRDTAANWTSEDPVLAQGEIGLETDTGKMKIGDGVTAWTLIDYFASGGALSVSELTLIPKESSTSSEGTIFYDSVDKCIYVGVET